MLYRNRVIITVFVIVAILISIGVFIRIVDPYQQYGKRASYLGDQRMEIAGVAKHHDYNAFITGSSMAMNHYPSQADSLWGWKTKNFTMFGAAYDDYMVVLPYILSQGKTQNVIMGLDMFSFSKGRHSITPYLYDDNVWNNYEYHWNYTALRDALRFLNSPLTEQNLYHFSGSTSKEKLKNSYHARINGYPEDEFDFDLMKSRFDESILLILDNAPDTIKWMIYFPPYSVAEFIIYDKTGVLDANMDFKKYMISRLLRHPNVELFDFQCSPWIINLEEYMDVHHHSHKFNRAILQAIHDGEYRADSSGHVEEIRQLITQYKDSLE